ncbi:MAG: hypothetical protein WCB70_09225, partial [Xanthobacteraceae bacterium]
VVFFALFGVIPRNGNHCDFFFSLVIRAAMSGSSLTLYPAFRHFRNQTAESGLERLESRLAVIG